MYMTFTRDNSFKLFNNIIYLVLFTSWTLIGTKETSGAKFMAILVSDGNNMKVFLSDDCITTRGIYK